MTMINERGAECKGNFQIADGIKKPLAAVSDSCDEGNLCLFDNDGSFIIRRESTEGKAIRELAAKARAKIELHRKNGVYTMPVWIQEPPTDPFPRPGQ